MAAPHWSVTFKSKQSWFSVEAEMSEGIIYSQRKSQELKKPVHARSLQLCPTFCDPMDSSPPRLLCPWDSPGKNTGVGCHALLQEKTLYMFFILDKNQRPFKHIFVSLNINFLKVFL